MSNCLEKQHEKFWSRFSGFETFEKFEKYVNEFESWDTNLESPIEAKLFDELIKINLKSKNIKMVVQCSINFSSKDILNIKEITVPHPNIKDNNIRLDFAFFYKGFPLLNVECDGKDSHASYTDQLKDRSRDEFVKSLGFSVMRFTGSEITREAWFVADRIEKMIEYTSKLADLQIEFLQKEAALEFEYGGVAGFNELNICFNKFEKAYFGFFEKGDIYGGDNPHYKYNKL
jgi:hypothetical protein